MWFRRSRPQRALIVEDDHALAELLCTMAQEIGLETRLAKSGTEALKLVAEEHFTLIITDIHLPDLDGISLLSNLKAQKLRIPVVLMTGNADCLGVNAERRGAIALLEKPFTRSQIFKVVAPYVSLKTKQCA